MIIIIILILSLLEMIRREKKIIKENCLDTTSFPEIDCQHLMIEELSLMVYCSICSRISNCSVFCALANVLALCLRELLQFNLDQ